MDNIKVNYVKKILSLNKISNSTMLNDKFFKRLSFFTKWVGSLEIIINQSIKI